MKIRTALFAAAASAFIASSGFAYAAYTGQLNIVQWAGAILGAPTAAGTPATGNVLGVQGVTNGVPMPVTSNIIQATVTPIWTANSATVQQLVALSGTTKVYVTSVHCQVQATATGSGDCQLVQGTGSNCATGQTALSEQFIYPASNGLTYGNGLGPVYISAAGNAVCIKTTLETSGIVAVGSIGATQF